MAKQTISKKTPPASEPAKSQKVKRPKQPLVETIREYIVTILVCLVIALFVVTFIVHPMAVPTESMQTPESLTIPGSDETYGRYGLLVGDRLLVDKLTIVANHSPLCRLLKLNHPVRRGDVVVFKAPDPAHYLVPYVKRVIGLPGETFEIRQNQVYINGHQLIEPYKYHSEGKDRPSTVSEMAPLKIPDHHYFVMGDNRDNSADSRYWGTVPEDFIFGKPLLILWSFPDNEVIATAFPDGRYVRGVHTIDKTSDILTLYIYRVIYFYKTRWNRMFHFIPRGNFSLS